MHGVKGGQLLHILSVPEKMRLPAMADPVTGESESSLTPGRDPDLGIGAGRTIAFRDG